MNSNGFFVCFFFKLTTLQCIPTDTQEIGKRLFREMQSYGLRDCSAVHFKIRL
jgi:hypothetical protein